MDFTIKRNNEIAAQRTSAKSTNNQTILLLEQYQGSRSMLKKALLDFNYHVIKVISFNNNLITEIEVCQPDILIMSTDTLTEELLASLGEINKILPLPIIIFSEHDSPAVIKGAINAGVSAFVVQEILPQRVQSIISVANERFKTEQGLRNELRETKTQLESRKLIERAKGLIMQQKQISESEAYITLRKMAMNQGHSIAMVSKNIIDVCAVLSTTEI